MFEKLWTLAVIATACVIGLASPAVTNAETNEFHGSFVNRDGMTSLRDLFKTTGSGIDATVGALTGDVEFPQSELESAGKTLRAGMVNKANAIPLSFTIHASGNFDKNEVLDELWDYACTETGKSTEGDYIAYSWSKMSYSGYSVTRNENDVKISITYNMSYYQSKEQEQELTSRLNELYRELRLSGKDPYWKTYYIYNYLAQNIKADTVHDSSYYLRYTPYAALINKTAVCQGISLLLYRMLMDNGIPCRFIHSDTHAWNIIGLNGLYYNCDLTWDLGDRGYKYFLRGDYFFEDHTRNEAFTTEEFLTKYPLSKYTYKYPSGDSWVYANETEESIAQSATPTPKPTATPTPSVQTVTLNAPANVTVTDADATYVYLKWNASYNAKQYAIFMKKLDDADSKYACVLKTASTSAKVTAKNGAYVFKIQPVKYASGNVNYVPEGYSEEVVACNFKAMKKMTIATTSDKNTYKLGWKKCKYAHGYQLTVKDKSGKTLSTARATNRYCTSTTVRLKYTGTYYFYIRPYVVKDGTYYYNKRWSPKKQLNVK